MNTTNRGSVAISESAGSTSHYGSWQDDPRVVSALEEYLALLKAGQRPTRQEFLDAHSDIASALGECLDGLEFVQSAVPRLPQAGAGGPPEESLPPSTRLGDYRIVREVGRGGMGIVYEAEQVSLGRRVALKVLPFSAAIDPRQRQRFQVEAQAAAHLHHAHIVPIFAVGCDQGVHYYAMQFIDGRSLAAIIRELRQMFGREAAQAAAEPAPALPSELRSARFPTPTPNPPPSLGSTVANGPAPESGSAETPSAHPDTGSITSTSHRSRAYLRTVAQLGAQAAEALDHAHALGVVHRDIKPSNLMIDARGELWVTDFGLARFQDDPGLTRTGDLVGTLRYMSPEQAMARRVVIDHRTDIYSLGATLYELMTLRPVFDGRDRQELLRQIATEEPIAPRRVNAVIPRDLETIVLKAMDKEPSRRYVSAQELADDLRRFLDDKPIQARRPTALEHAIKWSTRHKPIVATAATVLLLAAAVGGTLLWAEQAKTRAALNETTRAYEQMVGLWQLTYPYTDQLTMRAMQRIAEAGNLTSRDRKFYADAHQSYESIVKATEANPKLRAVTAGALNRVGFIRLFSPTSHGSAEEAFQRSAELYEVLIRDAPQVPEHWQNFAEMLDNHALVYLYGQRPPAAEPLLRRRVALQSHLATAFPNVADYVIQATESRERLASFLDGLGKPADAAASRQETMAFYAGMAKKTREARQALARAHSQYAGARMEDGDRQGAARFFRLANQLDPGNAEIENGLAWDLAIRPGEPPYSPAEALTLAKHATAVQPKIWMYWNTLGLAQYRIGAWDAAVEALKTSLALHDGGDANDWFILAMAQSRLGRTTEARDWFDKSVAWTKAHPPVLDLRLLEQEAKALLEDPHRRAVGDAGPGKPPAPAAGPHNG